ncbi:Hypothetical protein R9X50_00109400 [Acrodontium crateriforme]|uniref:N-acetyltransferase domain-containing protein n=1 Tax=Acrodontium crateriforme TaxID=150365 RepID=A0AAQ3M4G3_9PEZI|nr:Hypothetical protein R9X50_00109400 [Acrodontium crateriforme]
MSIKVLEAEQADFPRIFEICSLAFAHNEPFFDILYPEHWLESGRRNGIERMRQASREDKHTHFLKAVDESTGEIVGMAKWNVYDNEMPDLDKKKPLGDYWATAEDKAFAADIIQNFLVTRHGAIKASKGNLLSLDILTIHPDHQRRGVGGALVKWGTDIADKLNVETIVESSRFGKGLYLKNGFVFQRDCVLVASEKWNGIREAPKCGFAWLIRPKKDASK